MVSYNKHVEVVLFWIFRHYSFLLLLLIVFLLTYLWVRVPSGLPPCPYWVWPAVGHSMLIKGDLSCLFRRLRKEHGDIFSLWLGGQLVIVVNGFHTIKSLFLDHDSNFSWRPDILNCDLFHYGEQQ